MVIVRYIKRMPPTVINDTYERYANNRFCEKGMQNNESGGGRSVLM